MQTKPVVYVVDDDAAVREALERLVRSAGLAVETFSSAGDFISCPTTDREGCLILDVRMPGMNGIELQDTLNNLNRHIPIVFISGSSTISTSVKAMKGGATDFLEKPFDEETLFKAIEQAIEQDRQKRKSDAELAAIRMSEASLTPREREVFLLVAAGMLNKQIAYELGAAEKTIKIHRGRIMQKMKAQSLADLVRFTEKLK